MRALTTRRGHRILAAGAALIAAASFAASAQAGSAKAPRNHYDSYDLKYKGGEPSVGFDPLRHVAYYSSGLTTLKLSWPQRGKHPVMTRTDVSPPISPETLDTILFTDQNTGRTYESYLAGGCSILAYTDGQGGWNQSEGCGPGALLDHQSVGAGPVHAPVPTAAYKDAVYYCAQNSFNGACAVSLDGGRTFGPGVPAYNTPANGDPLGGQCSALHGHIKVGPDGTVYLPLKGCGGVPTASNLTNTEYAGGSPAVSVSEDNGLTWTVHKIVAGNNSDESDPSIGISKHGVVYEGWQDGVNVNDAVGGPTSSARIAVSRDRGKTWSRPVDVSTPLGLNNVVFPEVTAGDDDRAAFAFLGTKAKGDDQDQSFKGEWHLYIASTYDGGKTYSTVDVTPNDPVQRGCVDLQGLAPGTPKKHICSQRNMLDFNEMTVDDHGRPLVAYTDGCTGSCVTDTSSPGKNDEEMVARLTYGRGLYKAFDAVLAAG